MAERDWSLFGGEVMLLDGGGNYGCECLGLLKDSSLVGILES